MNVRPEIRKTSNYYISKHRYYELKHFCLQYNEWKEQIRSTEEAIHGARSGFDGSALENIGFSDSTGNQAVRLAQLKEYCELVEKTVLSSEPSLARYLFMAVTRDISFPTLKTKYEIPCGKDMYYNRYRKFFWLLSQRR